MSQNKLTKITPETLEKRIVKEDYHHFDGTNTIVCALTLNNDFVVVGKASCLSSTEFNPEIGKVKAREDAIRQLWELVGFGVKELDFHLSK